MQYMVKEYTLPDNVPSKSLQQFVLKYKLAFSIRISTMNFGFENNIKLTRDMLFNLKIIYFAL